MRGLIDLVESQIIKSGLKKDLPQFRVGDTVRVWFKIVENPSEKPSEAVVRLQPFEGIVIRYRGTGLSRTFTVRKISSGIGVERTFPLYSPQIEKIEVSKSGKIRRARLYYLRYALGRAARVEGETVKETTGSVSEQAEKNIS